MRWRRRRLGRWSPFVFSSQQVFTEIYMLGHYFPLAFAAIATGVAIAGFLNSRIVGRLGMRVISHGALVGFVVVAADHAGGGENADAASAPVHGAGDADDVRLRIDDGEFHGACDGAARTISPAPLRRSTDRSRRCSASASASRSARATTVRCCRFRLGFFLCALSCARHCCGDGKGPAVQAASRPDQVSSQGGAE